MPIKVELPAKATNGQLTNVTGGKGFELFYLRHDEGEKWYYCSTMDADEVVMLKIFDSKKDIARRVAHSAFEDPSTAADPIRESLEVRCLVFWEDQEN